MARGGAPSQRAKKQRALDEDERRELEIARRYMAARDELVSELWTYYHAISTRNIIIQRLQEYLTPEEKEALAHG